ncbi:hypothetical protein [Streptomyces nogalater]|uniref:hypothetical protein n=1 Tax=Streptomyces nogalater TaxID=38314 RepID=UPI0031D1ECB5
MPVLCDTTGPNAVLAEVPRLPGTAQGTTPPLPGRRGGGARTAVAGHPAATGAAER